MTWYITGLPNGTSLRAAPWNLSEFRLKAHAGTLYEFRIIVHGTLS